ncbi:hypothetical protein NQ315_011675 [Exocentrus adspersus]|uniref:Uncharacterized protein n=1 Tax=Exocentrus adspersus TaxID=1586481 RepID=A0AAV8W0X4_9CUCU|nr:hypothetical protein NQ315_011675 [Exocentrus adspersus]
MNPQDNPPSSPGFVYFNTNSQHQNQDFLSFSNSPPYAAGAPDYLGFSPVSYSSPSKFQQQSPRNYRGRHSGRSNFRYHNSRGSFNSPNSSFGSPGFNNSRNKSRQQHKEKRGNSFNSKNISAYFDHTCTKDPWAELEKHYLKEKQELEEKSKSTILTRDETESAVITAENDTGGSSSSEDEEEMSESEVKTSSSEIEEEKR